MNNRMKELIANLNRQGINTSTLIKGSGISRSQFYAILNGNCDPTSSTMLNIAKALDSDVQAIFFPEEDKKEESNE